MIIEEVIINDVKIVLSRGKGGKGGENNETYKFYIYIVNSIVHFQSTIFYCLLDLQFSLMA